MNEDIKRTIAQSLEGFQMPRYQDIPDVGLYLEQVVKYIGGCLAPLGDMALTSSMISNYVKKGLIPNPVKKQYSREQIAYLIFIAVGKSVLSLDSLIAFIRIQKQTYPLQIAYDYFAREFESLLLFTFELTDTADMFPETGSDGKKLLYYSIVASVQKVYLEKYLREYSN